MRLRPRVCFVAFVSIVSLAPLRIFAAPLDVIEDKSPRLEIMPVLNHSFEEFSLADGCFSRPFWTAGSAVVVTSDPLPGWVLIPPTGDGGTFNPTPAQYPGQAADGNNVAYSSGGRYGRIVPTLAQVLPYVLVKNRTYVLEVDIGNRLDTPFPGYSVQLLAGGVLLAEDNSGLHPAPGTFPRARLTYRARPHDPGVGKALEIRMRSFGLQTNFDNVTLVVYRGNVAPDPAIAGEEILPPSAGRTSSSGPDAYPARAKPGASVQLGFSPHPFRSAGTAWLSFPRGGEPYRLEVFDAQGRRVSVLADGIGAEGSRVDVIWNGGGDRVDSLPPGVYFPRLVTGGDTAVTKVLKLK